MGEDMSEEIKTVSQLEEKLIKDKRREAKEAIDSIFENINIDDINKLPENIFVSNFLSLFHGDITDNDKRMVLTQHWVNIAGSPSKEVAVVNNKGEELYRVPPIFNSSSINVTQKGRKSINEIIVQSESDGFKPRANLELINNLDIRQEELLAESEKSKTQVIEKLNKIFVKYKLPLFDNITNKEENKSDDDVSYDE